MKTPEEMAEQYAKEHHMGGWEYEASIPAWLAGYQAAMNSPEKLDSWISVEERLPNLEKTSRSLRRESSCILLVSYGNVYVAHLCEDWSDRSLFIFEACTCNCRAFDMEIDEWKLDQVSHWMPLPAPPKEEA